MEENKIDTERDFFFLVLEQHKWKKTWGIKKKIDDGIKKAYMQMTDGYKPDVKKAVKVCSIWS